MTQTNNRYCIFFTRNIKKYIESSLYQLLPEESLFSELKAISHHECERWRKSPLEYLSSKEALALALHFSIGKEKLHYNHLLFAKVMDYFERCLRYSKCKKEIHLANLSLGVVLFEQAVHSERDKQKGLLSLSKHYLEEALLYKENTELLFIYLTLVEVSSGHLSLAIKNLTKASKVSLDPLPIWSMLASIYKNLQMPEVSEYFLMKVNRLRSFQKKLLKQSAYSL